MNVTIEQIAEILRYAGKPAPAENIRTNWPLIEAELVARGMGSNDCLVAAIATVAVETGSFVPCKERGGIAYLTKLYEGRKDLGNVNPGDGALFRGRGDVQTTGRANYQKAKDETGIDFIANPDLALVPENAAKLFALFFRDHRVADAANAQQWELVRRRVNGGLNAWAEFSKIVQGLKAAIGEPIPSM